MTIPKSASADDKAAYYAHLQKVYQTSGRTQSSFVRNGIRAKELDEALQAMSHPKSVTISQSKPLVRQDTWIWMEQRELELKKKF
jgi:hypothetical protein